VTQRAAVPARRLLAAVALSVVAVGALSACQDQAGTAAFVGGTRITVGDVEKSVDGILAACDAAKASASATAAAPPACGPTAQELRALAVQDKVTIAVASRYAAEHGIKPPVVDPQEIATTAQQLGIAANDPFINEYVTARAWANALDDAATPVTPTEAELHGIYDRARSAGVTNQPYAQVRAPISQITGLGQAVAVQRELAAAATSYGVSIGPRYQPSAEVGTPAVGLQLPLLQIQGPAGPVTVLSVDFGQTASPAVVSVPSGGADNAGNTGTSGP
jgi:hypothetical protein